MFGFQECPQNLPELFSQNPDRSERWMTILHGFYTLVSKIFAFLKPLWEPLLVPTKTLNDAKKFIQISHTFTCARNSTFHILRSKRTIIIISMKGTLMKRGGNSTIIWINFLQESVYKRGLPKTVSTLSLLEKKLLFSYITYILIYLFS